MSIQLFAIDLLLRATMKRRMKKNPDVLELRPIMAEAPKRTPPSHISMSDGRLNGVPCEVLKTADAKDGRAILYIHGGGWVAGAPWNHRALTWRLAAQTQSTVYAIDYRLAPEHPFPAGLDDCVAAYGALLDMGIPPGGIIIGGDSAGGNLTFATALKLKQDGLPQPAGLVALSPATELADRLPSHQSNIARDAMFNEKLFGTVAAAYCPNHDTTDPLISPLRGDVSGLAPTLIQCSRDEMLRDDGVKMAEKLNNAGVSATLEIWPKVFHVWQITADMLPEARKAIANIAAFINTRFANTP